MTTNARSDWLGEPETYAFSMDSTECLYPNAGELHALALRGVLVVEGEVELNYAVCMRLQRKGVRTVSDDGGLDGVGLFLEADPERVILDLRLPRMNGLKVLNPMRMARGVAQWSVIVLAGDPTRSAEEGALRAGVVEVLRKPIGQRRIVQAASDALLYG